MTADAPYDELHRTLQHQKHITDQISREHIAWVLRQFDVNCVIDVGANLGQYAQRMRASGYEGRIVSFEPVTNVFQRLSDSAADDPQWVVHPYAVGRESGTTYINSTPSTMLSSFLSASNYGRQRFQKRLTNARKQRCAMKRLDEIFDEIVDGIDQPRVYLKLDTQGYDVEAFAGLGAAVNSIVGMQSEVAALAIYENMPTMIESLMEYTRSGFEITGMYPVSQELDTGRVLEFDCILVRSDKLSPERRAS